MNIGLNKQQTATALEHGHPTRKHPDFLEAIPWFSAVFGTHAEFLAYYKQLDSDFIFDKASGLYLMGYQGQHCSLLARLYAYYGGIEESDFEAADRYVLEGHGMFKSRAGQFVYRGRDFSVPAELFSIMRDIKVLP